ncbi:MAG: hypothetical protein D6725_05515 [Planctomycetota bacterium]|nr:MAG: hypothetical protein D6725_05515 [Planctomycetota bacterium]
MAVRGRADIPHDSFRRSAVVASIGRIVGSGVWTGCGDCADAGDLHPAPYGATATALRQCVDSLPSDRGGYGSPIVRRGVRPNVTTARMRRKRKRACEAAAQAGGSQALLMAIVKPQARRRRERSVSPGGSKIRPPGSS